MRTVVMTGGTSGFGKVAVERMTAAPDVRVLLGARRDATSGAETFPLDLRSLDSVRSFARAVTDRLGATEIDTLVLNAGWFGPADQRTADGYATTFVVNHLAHYLLVRLLMPLLATGATIVLATSGTHDPAERAGLPTPHHADARLLARNSIDAAGGNLAKLALAEEKPPAGRIYTVLRKDRLTWKEPSELARRDDAMHALWRDSGVLVAMDESPI